MLTLNDLLDQRDLGLELLVGESEAPSRSIAGAYVVEVGEPREIVPSGWLALTMGLCLQGDERAQRRLVADADAAGLSALGFGVKVVFDRVPAAMRAEAERRGFPLLAVPPTVSFRDIVGFVARAQLSREMFVLQRALSTQTYLMSALTEPQPAVGLAQHLAEVLSETVVVYRTDGRVDHATGDAPRQQIWSEIRARSARLEEFTAADWTVISTPVVVGDRLYGWLAVTSRRPSHDPGFRREVVKIAQRLLGVVFQARQTAATEERRMRAEMLHMLLSGGPRVDWTRLHQRAAALGLDLSAPVRALVVSLSAGGEAPTSGEVEARLTQLERLLVQEHVSALLARREDHLIVLAQMDGHDLAEWVRALASPGVVSIGGLGRPLTRLQDAQQSVRDAELAVRKLTRVGADSGTVLSFEDLDLTEWLLADQDLSGLQPRIQSVLAPLKEHAELHETLVAYLAADLNITATARALHLHPNSLRYRLGRIEKLLGRSLSSFPALVDLYLSMLSDLSPRDAAISIVENGKTASAAALAAPAAEE